MAEKSGEYQGGKGPRVPEQIEEPCAAAGEREPIARLTGCVADLKATKRELAILSAVEVREALAQCRNSLRGAQ